MWWCRCAVCLRCECARKTIFHTSSEGFPSSHQPSAVVDLLRPDFPSPRRPAGECCGSKLPAMRQCGCFITKARLRVCGCFAAPLFSSAFIFSLHSKLSLRRLNSWKFHSEGVTHIFLQLRLFKRENIKGKLKAQGKLAKESWIKVECRKSEGKFCVEKIIFRQVKVFVFGNFCEKTVKWKIQNSSNARTGKRKSENKINCKAFGGDFCKEKSQTEVENKFWYSFVSKLNRKTWINSLKLKNYVKLSPKFNKVRSESRKNWS